MAVPPPVVPSRATLKSRFGIWLFAIVFIVVFPLFPVFVEAIKHGHVQPETYLLTAAVLAVTYGLTSKEPTFWAFYSLIFLGSLVFDARSDVVLPSPQWPAWAAGVEDWITNHVPLSMLLLVTLLHTLERFIWHVVWDRLFPDWRE